MLMIQYFGIESHWFNIYLIKFYSHFVFSTRLRMRALVSVKQVLSISSFENQIVVVGWLLF